MAARVLHINQPNFSNQTDHILKLTQIFAHFHTSIVVPGKALFTLPVVLDYKPYVSDYNTTDQNLNNYGSMWVCPRHPAVISKTKQLPSAIGKKEVPKLYHSPRVPLHSPGGFPGSRPMRKQNDKYINMGLRI